MPTLLRDSSYHGPVKTLYTPFVKVQSHAVPYSDGTNLHFIKCLLFTS